MSDAPDVPRALRYAEYRPGGIARSVALSYWSFDVRALPSPDFTHRVWPDGCCSLVVVQIDGRIVAQRVQGTLSEPIDVAVAPGTAYRGIRFRPEMGARWLRRAAVMLPGLNIDAFEVFGDALAPLLARLAAASDDASCVASFDAWIAARCATDGALLSSDPLVRRTVDLLLDRDGQCRMASVARALGVHPRTIQRRFQSAVGLTPKAFAQIRRTQAVIRRAAETDGAASPSWSRAAAEAGFADQAHLTRDVRRRTMMSPTRLRERLAAIEHGRLVE